MRPIYKALLHPRLTMLRQVSVNLKELVMYLRKGAGPHVVTLPDGSQMSRADLPPPGTTRWVARRKESVVRGVQSGLIGREEAIDLYDLSDEEYDSWEGAMVAHGTNGLKTTLIQRFRQT